MEALYEHLPLLKVLGWQRRDGFYDSKILDEFQANKLLEAIPF
jgi:hypothetical protein